MITLSVPFAEPTTFKFILKVLSPAVGMPPEVSAIDSKVIKLAPPRSPKSTTSSKSSAVTGVVASGSL